LPSRLSPSYVVQKTKSAGHPSLNALRLRYPIIRRLLFGTWFIYEIVGSPQQHIHEKENRSYYYHWLTCCELPVLADGVFQ
jgi:hypothetical protein